MMAEVVAEALIGRRAADRRRSALVAAARTAGRIGATARIGADRVRRRDRDALVVGRSSRPNDNAASAATTSAELVERATLCSRASVARLRRASAAVHREVSITSGEMLEPALPAMREAMCEGLVGVDGLVAIAGPLLSAGSRISREALLAADAALAAESRGEGPDAAPPPCADLLRLQAQAWSTALDQDGAEPRERMTAHKRGFTLGTPTDAGVPCRGNLMPEVAAQLQRIFDAHLNPHGQGVRFAEHAPERRRHRSRGDPARHPHSGAEAARCPGERAVGRGIQRSAADDRRSRAHPRRVGA